MDTSARQSRIRALLAGAPRDALALALAAVLEATASAQEPLSIDDFGIGGCLDSAVVEARHDGRSTVGDEVDGAILDSLARAATPPGAHTAAHRH